MKVKVFLLPALCMALPALGMAVTEGVVEEAPPVAIEEAQAQERYLPDESYVLEASGGEEYGEAFVMAQAYEEPEFDGNMFYPMTQKPQLLPGEAGRAKALLAQYEAGEAVGDGESVINAREDVVLGVYPLDPADFDGEQVYVLLPGTMLSQEQLLALIDAYHRLGLRFDPEGLNARNCARGGGIETSRFMTQGERARNTRIADLIRRGIIEAETTVQTMPYQVRLDSRYYSGLETFSLNPYRAMTDEEMLSRLVGSGVKDESQAHDFTAIERQARHVLNGMLAQPLSMALESIYTHGVYMPMTMSDGKRQYDMESREMVGASFTGQSAHGLEAYMQASFDAQTGGLVSATAMDMASTDLNAAEEVDSAVSGETCLESAQRYARDVLEIDADMALLEEHMWINWGECYWVRGRLENGLWISLYVGLDDGEVHGVALQAEGTGSLEVLQ